MRTPTSLRTTPCSAAPHAAPPRAARAPATRIALRRHSQSAAQPVRHILTAATAADGAAASSPPPPTLASLPSVPVAAADAVPATTAVYAMLDASNTVQYVGMSRRLATTVAGHAKDVPDRAVSVKFAPLPSASRDELTAVWRAWVQEVVDTTGSAPPGNLPDGQADWAPRRPPPPPPEIRLTPGKGLHDLAVGLDTLIRCVIDDHAVVAFIKGTRTAPQCGFSHSVVTMLTAQLGHGFGVVNVLDEVHNPGLRDAIKAFSAWPTIPQVYVHGEFVGGADVLAEMAAAGELGPLLKGETVEAK